MNLKRFLTDMGMELAINIRLVVTGEGAVPVKYSYYCVIARGTLESISTVSDKEKGVCEGIGRPIIGNGKTPADALQSWCTRMQAISTNRDYIIVFNNETLVVPKAFVIDVDLA